MVWERPLDSIALSIGASLTSLRKHCKRDKIVYPPKGYWQRRQSGYSHEESLKSQKKARTPKRKLVKEDMEKAIQLMNNGLSMRKAAKAIGFCHTTLRSAVVPAERMVPLE